MNRPTVIIPAFNCVELTRQCLDRLVDQIENEIVVIDDGSKDDTPRLLRSYGQRIKVITHNLNQGFAASCNDGAAAATGDSFVFLNNDTRPRPGWMDALVRYARNHPDASIVGSKLLYEDCTIQHAGVVICQDRYPRHIYTGFPEDHPSVNCSRQFQIVTAACMFVHRSVFENSGGFDDCFRNGFEDVDFCLRVKKSGGQIHYCSESEVEHLESVSPGRFEHDAANVTLYRERWFNSVEPDEWRYYLEDDLIRVTHEGRYPIHLDVSPFLATLSGGKRADEREMLIRKQARQLAGFERENSGLRLELARENPSSDRLNYFRIKEQIHGHIEKNIPLGSTLLFVSKGDPALVEIEGYEGWHFPMNQNGAYAGFHPPDSAAAITHLEELIRKGADYLVIPSTSLWWLEHYPEFSNHLDAHFAPAIRISNICRIYELSVRVGGSRRT